MGGLVVEGKRVVKEIVEVEREGLKGWGRWRE